VSKSILESLEEFNFTLSKNTVSSYGFLQINLDHDLYWKLMNEVQEKFGLYGKYPDNVLGEGSKYFYLRGIKVSLKELNNRDEREDDYE